MEERTLVLIKHDGVSRNLIGKIISRIEDIGLKIVGMRMVWANDELAKNHYFLEEEWARNVFEKSKISYEKGGKKFPYKDPMDFAGTIQKWNSEFLREGPVVALAISGPHAVEIIRKIIGSTEPLNAAPGTIRGDFSMVESYKLADVRKRVLRNLVHASDSVENGKREIALWFKENELHDYKKELDKHFK